MDRSRQQWTVQRCNTHIDKLINPAITKCPCCSANTACHLASFTDVWCSSTTTLAVPGQVLLPLLSLHLGLVIKQLFAETPPLTHLRHACMDSESLHDFLGDFSFVDFFLLDKDSSFLHEWKTFSIRLAEVCKVLSCSADNLCCSLNMHIIEKWATSPVASCAAASASVFVVLITSPSMQLNKSFNCGSYQLGSGHALCVTHGWWQVRDTNVKTLDQKSNTHQAVHTPLQVWDREATNNHSCPITVQVPGIGKHECNLSTFHTLPWQEKPNSMTNLVDKLM